MHDVNDKIAAAIDKLNSRLPPLERQRALPSGLIAAHRAVLRTLAEKVVPSPTASWRPW